ncbi:MAG: gamma-glutamylcyclotransferase [Nitrospira sp.]|nr:gamma-glutamylcyclotransferase [Nitrospira sp.]
MTLVFVYGTLKFGQCSSNLLNESEFVGPIETRPWYDLYHFPGQFPYLVKNGTHIVAGELYFVNKETLAVLDAYENHPHLYVRDIVAVHGPFEEVQTYFWAGPRGRAPMWTQMNEDGALEWRIE